MIVACRACPGDSLYAMHYQRSLTFYPGLLLADISVWQTCAMTLAAFNISHAIENGKIIEVENTFQSGTIRHVIDSMRKLLLSLRIRVQSSSAIPMLY